MLFSGEVIEGRKLGELGGQGEGKGTKEEDGKD